MLDSLPDNNERHGTPLSSKNLQEAVIIVVEEEEKYAKRKFSNITMDTLFRSPVPIILQKKDENVKNERQIASYIRAETMKEFKGFTIQSTIRDYSHRDSKELVDAVSDSEELVDAVSDPKSDTSSDPSSYLH